MRVRELLPLAAAALLVAAVGAFLPGDGFYCMDAGPKILQTRALVESRELPRAFPYLGVGVDPEGRFLPDSMQRAGSGAVSIFPVLLPLLAAPALALGGERALLLAPFLGALAVAWLAGRLARRLSGPRAAAPVAAVCLLATPLGFYALTFWEHAPAAALALAALLALVGAADDEAGPRRWALAGALLALAAGMRTEYVVLLPLALAPLAIAPRGRRPAATAAALAGAAGGLAAVAALQRALLGSWLPPHLVHNAALGKLPVHLPGGWLAVLAKFLAPDAWTGAAVALWALALLAAVLPRTRRHGSTRALAVAAAGGVLVAGLAPPLLRWLGGARPTAAFAHYAVTPTWLALAALPAALAGEPDRRHAAARRLLGAAALWMVAASALVWPLHADTMQWGGRQWLLAAVIGVTLMLTAPPAPGAWGRVRRAAVATAIAAGVGVGALGFALLHHATRGNRALVQRLQAATRPDEVIVTDTQLLAEYAAHSWRERTILCCRDASDLAVAAGRLAAAGADGWALAWVEAPGPRLADAAGDRVAAGGALFERVAVGAGAAGGRVLHVARYRRAGGALTAPTASASGGTGTPARPE